MSWWANTGSGLLGAVIGASAALAGQWQAGRRASREKRRDEQLDVLARFWAAVDRHWKAVIASAYAVDEYVTAHRTGDLGPEHEQARMEALRERSAADDEVRRLLALMRLLRSSAYEGAQALYDAQRYKVGDEERYEDERAAAQATFEAEATRLLEG